MLIREAAITNLIVFGVIWPVNEPSIYRTKDEHAIHDTTDYFTRIFYQEVFFFQDNIFIIFNGNVL